MPKNLPTFRKVGMLVFPVVVIMLAFSYYFFIYVKHKEKTVTARTYRILENANETIESKIDFYKNKIKNEANIKLNDSITFSDKKFWVKRDANAFLIGYSNKRLKKRQSAFIKTDSISIDELFSDISDNEYFEGVFLVEVIRKISKTDYSGKILYNTYSKADFLEPQIFKAIDNPEDVVETVKLEGEDYKLFFHNVTDLSDDATNYLLGGLIKEDRFLSKQKSIPSPYLLFFLVIFVLLIFSYPFLKLLLIGPLERVSVYDILLIVGSLILISSITTVTYWEIYNQYIKYPYQQEQELAEINRSIKKEFVEELKKAVTGLNMLQDEKLFESFAKNIKDISTRTANLDPVLNSKLKKEYNQYKRLSGDDNHGNQLFKFNADGERLVELTNVKDRTYFKDIKNQNYWTIKDAYGIQRNFSFQSVVSWTDKEKSVVIAIPSKYTICDLHVTTEPYSLTNTILPDDIQFCIIDPKGKVLVHSDIRKNLQENFLRESGNNPTLTSAIFGRKSSLASVSYLEEDHTAFISPIEDWPLFLIVFQNNKYRDLLSTEEATLCLEFTSIKFIVIVLLIFIQSLQFPKKKKLKFNGLQFDWLRPDFDNVDKYRKGFVFLFWVLINIGFWGCLFYQYNSLAPLLSLFFLLPFNIYLGLFICLNSVTHKNIRDPRFVSFFLPIAILIIFILIVTFNLNESPDNYYLLLFQFSILFPLFLINTSRVDNNLDAIEKTLTEIRLRKGVSSRPGLNYIRLYRLLILFWIATSSIIPHLMLYSKIHSFETDLFLKYDMLNIAKKIAHRVLNNNEKKVITQISTEGIYNITPDIIITPKTDKTKKAPYFNEILETLRLSYNSILAEQTGLLEGDSNTTWVWDENNTIYYKHNMSALLPPKRVLRVSKEMYPKNITIVETCYFISFFIILALLYQIINFFVQKIFILQLFTSKLNCTGYENDINSLLEQHKCLFVVDIFNIIRPLKYLDKKVVYLNDHPLFINYKYLNKDSKDDMQVQKELDEKIYSLFQAEDSTFLYSLTFNINDDEENTFKLLVLDKLIKNCRRVIIVSPLHPIQILRAYSKAMSNENSVSTRYSKTCDSWSSILKYFYIIYNHQNEYLKILQIELPQSSSEKSKVALNSVLENVKNDLNPDNKFNYFKGGYSLDEFRDELIQVIDYECKYSDFLKDISDPLYKYLKDIIVEYLRLKKYRISYSETEDHKEEVIVKIQNMAQVYYSSLWNNCSSEEKLILYDLAEDELLNAKIHISSKTSYLKD